MNTSLRWSDALSNKKFGLSLVISFLYMIVLAVISPSLFNKIQSRNGFVLHDPLLDILPAIDLSNLIFSILYILIIVTIVHLLRDPHQLLFGFQVYALMMTIRYGIIFLIPLEPPSRLVALRDPLTTLFFYGETVITKDLFFSGHAATLFLLFFLVKEKTLKRCLLAGSIIISTLLLVQHIHYTYDVLAAPVFAFATYKISGTMLKIPV